MAPVNSIEIKGSPTAEQVAAVVAVLASLGTGEPAREPARSLWATPRLRTGFRPGPGAWRASALPH